MKTLSFASRTLVSLLTVLGFVATSFVSAQVSNTYSVPPPPGYPVNGAPRQPTSTRASKQAAAAVQPPASYTYPPPPGYTYPPPPGYGTVPAKSSASKKTTGTPTKSTSAPKKSTPAAAPRYYGPTGDISTQVAKLAQSDKVQNVRLGELERDVGGIKRGGKGGSTSRYNGGTDLASHTTHVVRPGDTMWRIASAHRVSVGEIQQLNRLSGENVTIGQTLLIPSPLRSSATTTASYVPAKPGSTTTTSTAPATYVVKKGDSLKAIAIRHKVTTAALASANRIKDPNKVVLGQRLVIPGRSVTVVSSTKSKPKTVAPESSDTIPLPGYGVPPATPPPAMAPTAPAAPAPATPKSPDTTDSHRGILAYRVDRSDTIESIATQFSTTPDRIREMNRLQAGARLNHGDEIMVPAMGAVSVSSR